MTTSCVTILRILQDLRKVGFAVGVGVGSTLGSGDGCGVGSEDGSGVGSAVWGLGWLQKHISGMNKTTNNKLDDTTTFILY